jgi:hypothetical protein
MMVLPHAEAKVEEVMLEGHRLEVTLPQQQISKRRGRLGRRISRGCPD